ncbi:phosphatase PAP2 family protein [Saprospiraceae bacterium]|jgi:hypothetical protein|nr:phosphatase PAP2 family protein [Bacteroidota bacterium]MDB4727425.1 phosphatase PAP2 family protein [Saprospiraceae bacterium]MDF1864688.1 phosphatase PAP2 family protein [Saprospiraceae bacterium]
MKKCFSLLAFLIISQLVFSQYTLDKKKEPIYFGIGLGSAGIGMGLLNKYPELSDQEIRNLTQTTPKTPFQFDNWATKQSSHKAKKISDILLYTSLIPPAMLLFDLPTNSDGNKRETHAVLLAETFFLNWGLTNLAKRSAKRPRPFMYNDNFDIFPIDKRRKKDARMSFFSGHTSVVSAMYFLTASTFSEYYPNSKWKPFVWGTSISIPALTGFLRVKAGKHFPTDVLVGYAVGALLGGVLVPALHK